MINAIADLGKYEKRQNPNITNFDIWLEDSYDEKNYPHLLLIEFKKEKNENEESLDKDWKWVFSGVSYIEHSADLKNKIMYKGGKGQNGPDVTPTSKVTELTKTFEKKIKKWFSANRNLDFLDEDEKYFIQSIDKEFEEKSEEILSALKEKSDILDKGGFVISFVFEENGERKFIGDYPLFAKFINTISSTDYRFSKTFGTYSVSENKLCSICKKNKAEVFGYFTSLKFYTVDKAGMVTGGFDQSRSWKNYPICLDCALDIEMGIKMMEENLIFRFYGLRYYLIPKITHKSGKEDIIEEIITYKKSPKITDSDRLRITNAENEVFHILKDENNNVTFNLLFFDKPQKSVFRILASIEDVLPSRIKQLFDAKDFADNFFIFKNEFSKEGKQMFRFNFGALRTFFPNSKIEGNHDKYFLELTQKIFNDSIIDYQFIIQHIMLNLRGSFIKDDFFWFHSFQSFMLINFLNELNLFRIKNKENNMDKKFYESFKINSKDELEPKIEEFFDNFEEFFGKDARKSIFLIGVLTQFLLNIQSNERGATPFRSKLKGLKMDAGDIAALFPQIIEKLEQYKSNYYVSLENIISKYLISAGDFNKWKLSIDEMNFIFVLGMNLSKYFKIQSKENKEEE